MTLNKEVVFYKVLTFFLLCLVLVLSGVTMRYYIRNNAMSLDLPLIDKNVPHQEEIKKIIEPLRYSFIEALMHKDVKVSIDFDEETWTLHNVHHFDPDGNIVLDEGRFGICGSLAAYAYQKIKPLLEDRYKIAFVNVSESGFFPRPSGTHYVLRITDTSALFFEGLLASYILDPSFHRYQRFQECEDYEFNAEMESLDLLENKNKDIVTDIKKTIPIKIHNNYLISLGVEGVGALFDKDNFTLALTATRQYRYVGRVLLAFRLYKGKVQILKDEALTKQLIDKVNYDRLYNRLKELFEDLIGRKITTGT